MKIYCKTTNFEKGRPGWNRKIVCEGGRYASMFSFPMVSGKGVAIGIFSGLSLPAMVQLSTEFPANGEVEMSEEDLCNLSVKYGGKPEKVQHGEGRNIDLKWRDGRWI